MPLLRAWILLPYFRRPRHSLITLNFAHLIPCIPSWPSCGHFRLIVTRSHIDETCSKTSKMSLGGLTIKVRYESTKGSHFDALRGTPRLWVPLSLAQGSRHSLRGEMALSVPRATRLELVERSCRGVVEGPENQKKCLHGSTYSNSDQVLFISVLQQISIYAAESTLQAKLVEPLR